MTIHTTRRNRREPFPAPPNPGVYRKIAYTFVAVTVIIVVAALWFSSVRATVTVKVVRETTQIEASVDVARSPSQGQLSGRVVQGVFEKIQEFNVTPRTAAAPSQLPASAPLVTTVTKGKVHITNTTSKAQPLVKTTRLLTADGKLFRIDGTVSVPAKGSVDVGAYSDKPGQEFVIPEKTHFTIPGLSESLQKVIYADSLTSFLGVAGKEGEKPATTGPVTMLANSDLDTGEASLRSAIMDTAKQTLMAEVGDDRFTEVVYLVKPLERSSNVRVGDVAERFLLKLKLDVTAVFYSKADMESLVRQRINEKVPEGRSIVSFDPSKTVFTVSQVDVPNEKATISLKADVVTKISEASPNLSKDLILGLPIDEAETKLKTVDGVEDATITVRPSWVRRLPTLKEHITIKVE
jgi:hypothetical protein